MKIPSQFRSKFGRDTYRLGYKNGYGRGMVVGIASMFGMFSTVYLISWAGYYFG